MIIQDEHFFKSIAVKRRTYFEKFPRSAIRTLGLYIDYGAAGHFLHKYLEKNKLENRIRPLFSIFYQKLIIKQFQ
jgi:hypothetical protein